MEKENNNSEFCSAVILCAGSGRRMNAEKNKLFIPILSKPVVAYTLEAFQQCKKIDEIIIVTKAEDFSEIKDIVNKYSITKAVKIVEGGKNRRQSSKIGVSSVNNSCSLVAIHDGARPFVLPSDIENTLLEASKFGSAVLAVKVLDTHVISSEKQSIKDFVTRDFLWAVQTPQCFKKSIITSAHVKADLENIEVTDDSSVAIFAGNQVKLVEGSYDNIKITTKHDISLAELIVKKRSN